MHLDEVDDCQTQINDHMRRCLGNRYAAMFLITLELFPDFIEYPPEEIDDLVVAEMSDTPAEMIIGFIFSVLYAGNSDRMERVD